MATSMRVIGEVDEDGERGERGSSSRETIGFSWTLESSFSLGVSAVGEGDPVEERGEAVGEETGDEEGEITVARRGSI